MLTLEALKNNSGTWLARVPELAGAAAVAMTPSAALGKLALQMAASSTVAPVGVGYEAVHPIISGYGPTERAARSNLGQILTSIFASL